VPTAQLAQHPGEVGGGTHLGRIGAQPSADELVRVYGPEVSREGGPVRGALVGASAPRTSPPRGCRPIYAAVQGEPLKVKPLGGAGGFAEPMKPK
jgi:hypothetical protein